MGHALFNRQKPVHTLRIHGACQPLAVPQVMEVRDGFAHGKRQLMGVQGSFEEHRQHLQRCLRLRATSFGQFGQALGVVLLELRHARVEADKRLAV